MKVFFYRYKHIGDRPKGEEPIWVWNQVLIEEARGALESKPEQYNIPGFASIGVCQQAPMRSYFHYFSMRHLLEIELPFNDEMRIVLPRSVTPCWVVECFQQLGYYILVRWLGSKAKDGAFWVHFANANVHHVGWVNETTAAGATGRFLVPPHHIIDNMDRAAWPAYLQQRCHRQPTASENFDERGTEISSNKFRLGERVETIHDDETSVLMPAIITKIISRRVLLEYSKADIDEDQMLNKNNMWKDMNDDLIYPVGFAATMGLQMTANKPYRTHVDAIAKAIKNGDASIPYDSMDATKDKVYEKYKNKRIHDEWKAGMVCEMIDRLDAKQNVLTAARVIKVFPDGYLQLGPEGPDIVIDSLLVHQTSTLLFPVGYAQAHGIKLVGPAKDNETTFKWDSFLEKANYECAPDHFFYDDREYHVPFKVGQRLEAFDQNEKLLCPATVKAIKGRLVLISFDGWDSDDFDQLYDFRSSEMMPCGWGEMVNHALQRPERPWEPSERLLDVQLRAVKIEPLSSADESDGDHRGYGTDE